MSAEGIRIREATRGDIPTVARIAVDTWRSAYKNIIPAERLEKLSYEERENSYREFLDKVEDQRRTFLYVAEIDEGKIPGFVAGGIERSGDSSYRGEIYQLYVLDEYQRQGIGRSLWRRAVERLNEMGFDSFMLWVFADNPYRGFYDRLHGRLIQDRFFEWEGITYRVVAYGWDDIRAALKERP